MFCSFLIHVLSTDAYNPQQFPFKLYLFIYLLISSFVFFSYNVYPIIDRRNFISTTSVLLPWCFIEVLFLHPCKGIWPTIVLYNFNNSVLLLKYIY